MSFSWDSDKYLMFEKERALALYDLIRKIQDIKPNISSILDIGCGSGNSSRALAKYNKDARILGIDNSQNMLSKAINNTESKSVYYALMNANNLNEHTLSQLSLITENASMSAPEFKHFDLIFANASLHWIEQQEAFLRELFALLNPDGIIAVQIPLDHKSLFHTTLQRIIASKWQNLFCASRAFHSLMDIEYLEILRKFSKQVYMWESTYYHVLDSIDSIITWYEGSGLRPYLEKLTPSEQENLKHDLLKELNIAYEREGRMSDDSIIMRVPRLFFIAIKR